MKVAVTGAAGFVGKRVVAELAARGHAVLPLVRDDSASVVEGIATRAWDLETGGDRSLLEGCDVVVHGGAYLPRSWTDPGEARRCLDVNALGTLELLEASISAGVRQFIYLSAGNAYRMDVQRATEDAPLYPSHRAAYYLSSKLCGELYVAHAQQAGRVAACILRPSGIYGPGMRASGLVPILASRLRSGEKATIQDGGRYQVDLVYVDDVAAAVAAAIAVGSTGTFNIGSGHATSSLELATTLVELLRRDPSLIEVIGDRNGPEVQGFASLDIERARRDLRYEPRSLRAGLSAYLESLG